MTKAIVEMRPEEDEFYWVDLFISKMKSIFEL